jgi:phage terminase large subunit-like protein
MVVRHMPESTPPEVPDVGAFKYWKPDAQQRALDLLKEREQSRWRPFYCPSPKCNGAPHDEWDFPHARADQRPPKWTDDWLVWLLSGGRGSGKTRTGSETTHRVARKINRIILIAPTGPDLRETMVEGESGLLATAPPDFRPLWEPSKKKLTWPNGCVAQGFSAEEPDRLRGPQSGYIWADEPGHYPLIDDVWDNALFGLRIRNQPIKPKVVATTTPKPTKWMKALLKDPLTVTHRVSTYENLGNLADTYRRTVIDRYEGTRLGRQELHGELLEDVEGALWSWEMFHYIEEAPPLTRIVVAVDPAGTANKKSDETGIVVVGIGLDKNLYVLNDSTGKYSPHEWGSKANSLYEEFSADAIVPEKTYGQDMVRYVLENAGYGGARIIPVESRRGKAIRAEPIVALYEKGRVFHVGKRGDLSDLEDEQTSWIPGEGASPNRVDALVHGATELAKRVMPASIASPNTLLRNRRRGDEPPHLRAV